MIIFAFITIVVACLGLYGLASFTVVQQIKSISIKKVFGASINDIVFFLSKMFTKWILIANIIAWPIAYYAMNKWLENFAYRIEIGIWVFLTATIATILIAFSTVIYTSIKAATTNPIEALRYE